MIIVWRTQGRARGQVYTPYMQGAYQSSVGISGAAPVPPVVVTPNSGGYDLYTGRKKTAYEVRKDREKFGVIPKKVEKIIERVAVQYVDNQDSNYENMLHAALERQNQAYKALYLEVLRNKIAEELEEEEVTLLLMLH